MSNDLHVWFCDPYFNFSTWVFVFKKRVHFGKVLQLGKIYYFWGNVRFLDLFGGPIVQPYQLLSHHLFYFSAYIIYYIIIKWKISTQADSLKNILIRSSFDFWKLLHFGCENLGSCNVVDNNSNPENSNTEKFKSWIFKFLKNSNPENSNPEKSKSWQIQILKNSNLEKFRSQKFNYTRKKKPLRFFIEFGWWSLMTHPVSS